MSEGVISNQIQMDFTHGDAMNWRGSSLGNVPNINTVLSRKVVGYVSSVSFGRQSIGVTGLIGCRLPQLWVWQAC